MKNTISTLVVLSILSLTACSEEANEKVNIKEATSDVSAVDSSTTQNTEELNIEEEVVETFKTTITKEEFNNMFKLDPEEKQYENADFLLKDGSVVKGDYISYVGEKVFDYASAIFFNNNLTEVQFETVLTPNELEKALNLSFGKAEVTDHGNSIIEVIFDETLSEYTIQNYPFELD
jgi:hypothetical protein